jgi:hypothetical protein
MTTILPTLTELRTHYSVTDPSSGCWVWTGPFTANGYPRLCVGAKFALYPARLAWTLLKGDVPAGMRLMATCGNRACINPEHRRPVTQRELARELAETGRISRGVLHGLAVARGRRRQAKLSLSAVEAIRRARGSRVPASELARQYQVSKATIYSVARNQTWRTAEVFRL